MTNNKNRFIPHNIAQSDDSDFADLLANIHSNYITEGSVVKGQVVRVESSVIVVDVGLKNEGRIPKEEFLLKSSKLPEVGEIVEVYVEKIEGRNGRTILSREKAIREESWGDLEIACNEGTQVNGIIFGRVKGGFTVDLSGVVAFLPGSQVDVKPIKDMTPLMGVEMPFRVLKMDKTLGNIVVSRRVIIEESRSEARDAMLSNIKEGMELEGIVKNITDYGAFIDLGMTDGLLHVTDITWRRINHPSEVLSIGQKVKVMVIKFHEDTKRISLGMKQLDDTLWQEIKNEFPVDQIFTGKVSSIADYGAFIELKNGIEGLVHSSEISWNKSNQHPKKLLNIHQEVQFKVLEIDTEKHRISLSIKQCNESPLLKFAKNHPVGSIISAPVRNIIDFGIFLAVDDDIDGMIHESDISWDGKTTIKSLNKQKGDIIECKVLAIDTEKERISLGIKQLTEEPEHKTEELFKVGMNVTCIVSNISSDGIEVTIDNDTIGNIKKAELSSDKTEQKPERFSIGDRIDAKVIGITKTNTLNLSIKAFEVEEHNRVIKDYGSKDSGASLGDILGSALNQQQIKNDKDE